MRDKMPLVVAFQVGIAGERTAHSAQPVAVPFGRVRHGFRKDKYHPGRPAEKVAAVIFRTVKVQQEIAIVIVIEMADVRIVELRLVLCYLISGQGFTEVCYRLLIVCIRQFGKDAIIILHG